MERSEILKDILSRNFNLAIKYRFPEISCYDEYVTITYHPKDEFKETEQKMVIYLGDNIGNDNCDDAQVIEIKL